MTVGNSKATVHARRPEPNGRNMEGPGPPSAVKLESALATHLQRLYRDQGVLVVEDGRRVCYYCTPCKKWAFTDSSLADHLQGKKHRKTMETTPPAAAPLASPFKLASPGGGATQGMPIQSLKGHGHHKSRGSRKMSQPGGLESSRGSPSTGASLPALASSPNSMPSLHPPKGAAFKVKPSSGNLLRKAGNGAGALLQGIGLPPWKLVGQNAALPTSAAPPVKAMSTQTTQPAYSTRKPVGPAKPVSFLSEKAAPDAHHLSQSTVPYIASSPPTSTDVGLRGQEASASASAAADGGHRDGTGPDHAAVLPDEFALMVMNFSPDLGRFSADAQSPAEETGRKPGQQAVQKAGSSEDVEMKDADSAAGPEAAEAAVGAPQEDGAQQAGEASMAVCGDGALGAAEDGGAESEENAERKRKRQQQQRRRQQRRCRGQGGGRKYGLLAGGPGGGSSKERNCFICGQLMKSGDRVATLWNTRSGQPACHSRNDHGKFHIFHVPCIWDWLLFSLASVARTQGGSPASCIEERPPVTASVSSGHPSPRGHLSWTGASSTSGSDDEGRLHARRTAHPLGSWALEPQGPGQEQQDHGAQQGQEQSQSSGAPMLESSGPVGPTALQGPQPSENAVTCMEDSVDVLQVEGESWARLGEVFCPECQGTGHRGEGGVLEHPRHRLSEVYDWILAMLLARDSSPAVAKLITPVYREVMLAHSGADQDEAGPRQAGGRPVQEAAGAGNERETTEWLQEPKDNAMTLPVRLHFADASMQEAVLCAAKNIVLFQSKV